MSLDLFNEFANSQRDSRQLDEFPGAADTIDIEDDDFGDFEDPGTKDCTNAENLQATHISAYKEDKRGNFEDQAVFFDADQIITKQHERSSRAQIPLEHIGNTKDILRDTTVAMESSPINAVVDEAGFDDWPETSQDPIIPMEAPTSKKFVETLTREKTIRPAGCGPSPSNVPPPSILLPLVTTTFRSLASDVKMVVSSGFDLSDHSSPLDQAKIYQVKDAIATARAGARIIAGRKLRWKRDTLLSQSMKIGPANGKAGGMKLVGVDKNEIRREDAEAAEAVRGWKLQVGGLRSAIATSNLEIAVPDIVELMPVRTMKASEGAVTAPKCCFLCGIKRDERVAKVDINVEDSFGEWWTEHWGHVDCTSFWTDHKASLSQR